MSFKVKVKRKRSKPSQVKTVAAGSQRVVEIVTNTAYRAARRNAIILSGEMKNRTKKRIEKDGDRGVVYNTDPGAVTQEFSPRGHPFFRPANKTAKKRIKKEWKNMIAEMRAKHVG